MVEKQYPVRGQQSFLNWNPRAKQDVVAIGQYVERLAQRLESEVYPTVDIRSRDGSWNVNLIVETAVVRLARDVARIPLEDLQRHAALYYDNRGVVDEHKLHIPEFVVPLVEQIGETLERRGVPCRHGSKLMKKQYYSMALSYTAEYAEQR